MTIHLKGVGWTEYDNIYIATYDNAYMGYACGFNSQGDVVINFTASGAPGGLGVEIFSAASPGHPMLAAPAGTGTPGWRVKVGAASAYVFVNASAPDGLSPLRKVSLKQGRTLKVVAKSLGGLPLTGAQGSVAIRITMGSLRSCAAGASPPSVRVGCRVRCDTRRRRRHRGPCRR